MKNWKRRYFIIVFPVLMSLVCVYVIEYDDPFIINNVFFIVISFRLTFVLTLRFRVSFIQLINRFHDEEHANLLNSMWLIAITFLSVGFGDIVPNTYCGRGIAVSTGIMVSSCTIINIVLCLFLNGKMWNHQMENCILLKMTEESFIERICQLSS